MKNTKIISVTWQSLSASVKEKPILKDCSGYCQPGEMLAIMGPSGAGKTTLLSLISKRHSSSLTVEGEV
jgi:ABC-type multidrug transport system ATPase subunit